MSQKIFIRCPSCSTRLGMSVDRAGTRIHCPKCKGGIKVPVPEAAPGSPAVELPDELELSPLLADTASDLDEFDTSHDTDTFSLAENPFVEETHRGVLTDDFDYREEYAEPNDESPARRAATLPSDIAEELVPRRNIPTDVQRLVSPSESFLFADRPSIASLYIRLGLYGIPALLLSAVIFHGLRLYGYSFAVAALPSLISVAMVLYVTYLAWASQFFAISDRHVIQRSGWFSHRVRIAPTRSIQLVDINTGIVDRLLGLSSIVFETAAASRIGALRFGILQFSNVHCVLVLKAYRRARTERAPVAAPVSVLPPTAESSLQDE